MPSNLVNREPLNVEVPGVDSGLQLLSSFLLTGPWEVLVRAPDGFLPPTGDTGTESPAPHFFHLDHCRYWGSIPADLSSFHMDFLKKKKLV